MSGPLTYLTQRADAIKRRFKDLAADPVARLSADLENILADYKEDPLTLVGPHIPTGGLAGVIRRNGTAGLNSWLEIPEENLVNSLVHGRGELDSPSLYVAKGVPRYRFGDIALIAKPDALDPARRPGRLYNRDAWTPTKSEFEPNNEPATREYNRFGHGGYDDYRGSKNLNDIGHRLMIEQSPTFKSFKDYENSPYGANVLTNSSEESGLPKSAADDLRNAIKKETLVHNAKRLNFDIPDDKTLDKFISGNYGPIEASQYGGFYSLLNDFRLLNGPQKYQQFLKTVKEGNPNSQAIMKQARLAPSNYGELKISGPLSITRDNFIAAIPQGPSMMDPLAVEALRLRGIPSINTTKFAPGKQGVNDLINMITEESAYPLEHLMIKPSIEDMNDSLRLNNLLFGPDPEF